MILYTWNMIWLLDLYISFKRHVEIVSLRKLSSYALMGYLFPFTVTVLVYIVGKIAQEEHVMGPVL